MRYPWDGRGSRRLCFSPGRALETRCVEIAGIIGQPHGAWMLQVARISSTPKTAS